MIVVKEPDFGTSSLEHDRTQGRLNSRVPVAIEWAEGGPQLRTEGYTVDVSSRGCLAVVTLGFTVGEQLRLMNLADQNSCEAVPAWCRNEGDHKWAVGLELREPGLDFWGLEL